MPLLIRCPRCQRSLELDPAFAGASCRCRYCRAPVDVARPKARAGVERPSARAAHPPLIHAGASKAGRRTSGNSSIGRSRASKASIIAGSLAALGFAAFTAYRVTRPGDVDLGAKYVSVLSQDATSADGGSTDPQIDAINHPVRGELCGVSLRGRTVALVVDSDSGMASYIDGLASIVESVLSTHSPRFSQFGVAVANDGMPLTHEPAGGRSGAALGARAALMGRVPTGKPDLATALTVAANWRPDQLFIVLDRPLSEKAVEVLAQKAEQSGAETHVIALGAAVPQADSLATIAGRRGGRVRAMDDQTFHSLVDTHRQLLVVSNATIMKEVKR